MRHVNKMEYAIYVKDVEELKKYSEQDSFSKYSHVYFGQEFCEKKIPSPEEYFGVLELCHKTKKTFVMLTPFVTNVGLKKIENIVSRFSEFVIDNNYNIEIVVNELGVLHYLKNLDNISSYFKFNLGRLMLKMKKGPEMISNVIEDDQEGFRQNNIMVKNSRDSFKAQGITRFEVDVPFQNIDLPEGENITVYHGNCVISCTRRCTYIDCFTDEFSYGVGNCHQECKKLYFVMNIHGLIEPVYRCGNADIIINKDLPEDMKNRVNRIVVIPNIKTVI